MKSSATLRRLAGIARPLSLELGGSLLLLLISTPLSLLLPLPLKIAVDSLSGHPALPSWLGRLLPHAAGYSVGGYLAVALGLLLGVSLLINLQSLASWLLQTYTGERLVLELRMTLFWHAQRLQLASHDKRGPSDLAYRIQFDAPAVQNIFLQGLLPVISSGFTFVAMLLVTAYINWRFAAVALLTSPVLVLLARRSGLKLRRGWEGVKELDTSAMRVLHEALSSIRTVKANAQEQVEDTRFRLRSRERMREQIRITAVQAGYYVLMSMSVAVGTAATLWVGVRQVQAGRITPGDLLLIMAYAAQVYEPLKTITSKMPDLAAWMVSISRAFAILDDTPEVAQKAAPAKLEQARGEVEFRGVSFAYPGNKARQVLREINFRVPAGTHVAIVGPSGSGKSTLMNLLTRFYDPQRGEVLLDGLGVRDYALADLRRQISIVLQDPVVFSTTVAENIAYARPQASRAEIIAAAQAACADEFTLSLPQGYDTLVGEQGVRLSGGQRQRLALARAFLKNAPLLVFDEPTSAVDVATEAEIIRATERLIRGRTTFVIAHRLSTVRDCDLFLVMKDGRVAAFTEDFQQAVQELLGGSAVDPSRAEQWSAQFAGLC